MGKVIGMLLVIVSLWVGMEVYLHGLGGAFDGALAQLGDDAPPAATPASVPKRAGAAVERAHREAGERLEDLLEE